MAAMIALYCRDLHGSDGELCDACRDLLAFAELRLRKCPFAEDKPTCASCPIHCYKPDRREQIRQVMRYSGPRMAFRHPLFALRHWLDGRREAPARRPRATREASSGDPGSRAGESSL